MENVITLSARMQAVVGMVSCGRRVVDVGCDHGYVSIYLVQNRISPGVLAMDVNQGPLKRAKEHVQRAGLLGYIELRLSDGLAAYRIGEGDTLIMAGMGGRLMRRILEKEPDKTASFEELILQPQSELGDFRKFLRKSGYLIVSEDMICEEDKFYPVIKAVKGSIKETEGLGADPMKQEWEGLDAVPIRVEVQDRYGPLLLQNAHPVLKEYLLRERRSMEQLKKRLMQASGSPKAEARLGALSCEMELLTQAFQMCGMKEYKYGGSYDWRCEKGISEGNNL